MIYLQKFGEIISEKRLQAKMTQYDLASQLMVTPQAVSKWERGASFPDIETLVNICEFFHLSIDDVINQCSNNIEITEEITDENLYQSLCSIQRSIIIDNILDGKYQDLNIPKIFYAFNQMERHKILMKVIDKTIQLDYSELLIVLNESERIKLLDAIFNGDLTYEKEYLSHLLSPIERKKYLSRGYYNV